MPFTFTPVGLFLSVFARQTSPPSLSRWKSRVFSSNEPITSTLSTKMPGDGRKKGQPIRDYRHQSGTSRTGEKGRNNNMKGVYRRTALLIFPGGGYPPYHNHTVRHDMVRECIFDLDQLSYSLVTRARGIQPRVVSRAHRHQTAVLPRRVSHFPLWHRGWLWSVGGRI